MHRRTIRLAPAVILIANLVVAQAAMAWGDNGHIAVAKVADAFLTPNAKQRAEQLLGGRKIYDRKIAMFADVFKFTHQGLHTKPWHFVDIPHDADGYDPARDCDNDDCVVARIEEFRTVLADPNASEGKQTEALKFLVHFVGDIHQPLHGADRNNDHGGNKVPVQFLGRREGRLNLHHVWDDEILDENMQGLDPEEYADQLRGKIQDDQKKEWEQNKDVTKWANESHKAAVEHAYKGVPEPTPGGSPFRLTEAYVEQAQPVVDEQIMKAGVRLAKLLNDALDH